jgi:hypothetical protein
LQTFDDKLRKTNEFLVLKSLEIHPVMKPPKSQTTLNIIPSQLNTQPNKGSQRFHTNYW